MLLAHHWMLKIILQLSPWPWWIGYQTSRSRSSHLLRWPVRHQNNSSNSSSRRLWWWGALASSKPRQPPRRSSTRRSTRSSIKVHSYLASLTNKTTIISQGATAVKSSPVLSLDRPITTVAKRAIPSSWCSRASTRQLLWQIKTRRLKFNRKSMHSMPQWWWRQMWLAQIFSRKEDKIIIYQAAWWAYVVAHLQTQWWDILPAQKRFICPLTTKQLQLPALVAARIITRRILWSLKMANANK